MQKWKLVGSAATLGDLRLLIIEKMYWSNVEFKEMKGYYIVSNSKGLVEGLRVLRKGKRFRLERIC